MAGPAASNAATWAILRAERPGALVQPASDVALAVDGDLRREGAGAGGGDRDDVGERPAADPPGHEQARSAETNGATVSAARRSRPRATSSVDWSGSREA